MLPLPAKTALGLRLTAQITMPSARTVPSESGGRLWLAQPWLTAKVVTVEISDGHLQWATLYTARSSAQAVARIKTKEIKRVQPAAGNPHQAEQMDLNFVSTLKWAELQAICNARGGFPNAVRALWQKLALTPLSHIPVGKYVS